MGDDVPQAYWKNLLELSTSAADPQSELDQPSTSGLPSELDEENLTWINEAMSDLVNRTDPSKQLSIVLNVLNAMRKKEELTTEDEDRIEEVGNALLDLLLFGDLTKQFETESGFEILTNFMLPKYPVKLQVIFGDAVLTLAGNNPPAQDAIAKSGLLQTMLDDVLDKSRHKDYRLKLLGSICAAVRSHEPSFEKFLELDGKRILSTLYEDPEIDIALKAARIVATVAFTYCDSKTCADRLYDELCEGYIVCRRRAGVAGSNELEYIRNFITDHMKSTCDVSQIIKRIAKSDQSDEEIAAIISSLDRL